MKTKLSLVSIKSRFVALLMLMLGFIALGQTTLVNYQFTNDLNPDAGALGSPTLTYHANGGAAKTPAYDANMLQTSDGGDYLELTINTTGRSGLVLSFNGDLSALGLTGRWNIAVDSGSGYVYRGQLSLFSIFGIRVPGNLSINLSDLDAAASNNPALKIKITADSDAWFNVWNLRIDNLKLTSGSPKIIAYTGNNTDADTDGTVGADVYIPHLSPASRAFDTDFGTRQTTGTALSRVFRIRNYGGESGSKLKVTTINVQGANPGDFTVTPNSLGDIDPTGTYNDTNNARMKEFTVSFLPLGDGIRTAEIYVYSNAAPNPYVFTVIGTGASCILASATTYAQNTMDNGQQALEANYNLSNDLIGGVAYTSGSNYNTLNTRLYPTGNLYTSASTSWYVRDTSKTVQFGGAAGLDISNQKNVSINFNVAAFSTASNRGVNSLDYVTLSVLKPDNTWSNELGLIGKNNNSNGYNYNFTSGSVVSGTYDGNNSLSTVTNSGSTKYNQFNLRIPASANIVNLKFRITAYSSNADRLWLIDDVRVLTSNAVYRTWSGTAWSTSKPAANEKAVFAGNYNFTATNNTTDLSVCECEVNSGATLTIPTGRTLTVRNKVVNNNTGVGSNFIVADGANLIQIENGAINTGNIEVQKAFTFSSGRQQYNYLSSPTVGTNVKSIYTGAEDPSISAMYYIESNDRFGNSSGAYIAGRALALQENKTGTDGTSANPAKFRGVPFNGTLDYPLAFTNAAHGYNLVGNPYPSALSIEELYEANLSAINSTFYFWDNRGNAAFTQAGSSYGGDSYAKYNALSGTGAGSGTKAPNAPDATRVPNGFVSTAQGFLVQAKAAGQVLKFSNTKMRVSNASTNFFGRSGAGTTKDRYWLTLKAPSSIETMMAVVYFDRGQKAAGPEDSENSGSSDEIYSMVGVQGLSINGLPVFDNEDVVAVGYRAFAAGTHTISLFNREGTFNNGQSIYLKDKQLNTITDLTQGDYTFETQKGTFTNRFEIVYKPQTILATDQAKSSSVMVYRDAADFVLQSSDKKIDWVEVYDMSGRLYKTIKGGDKTIRFSAQEMAQGMYILKIVREGEVSSKRILK